MKKIVASLIIVLTPASLMADDKSQVVTGTTPSQGARAAYEQVAQPISPNLWMVSVRAKK